MLNFVLCSYIFFNVVFALPYVPGTPGAPWTELEVLIVKAKLNRIYSWGGSGQVMNEMGINLGNAWSRYPSAPKALRLGFHDCLKYTDGTGGCDGCLNWQGVGTVFDDAPGSYKYTDLNVTDNNGLENMVIVLEEVYTNASFPSRTPALNASLRDSGKSRADLWALATITAVEFGIETNNGVCQNAAYPYVYGACHHEQGTSNCSVNLPSNIKFKTGRSDCITSNSVPYKSDQHENHPSPLSNGKTMINFFRDDFGLTGRETAALMGAHTFGRLHVDVSLFRYVWTAFGTDLFNNHYYKNIIRDPEYYLDGKCNRGTDAWGRKPTTRWTAHVRMDTTNGGPAHWIHENLACPVCQSSDDQCCTGNPNPSVNYCTPDSASASVPDPNVNGGCEKYRFIVGIDEMALSCEMGLYFDFEVKSGFPIGCAGFEYFNSGNFSRGYKYRWTLVNNKKSDPMCNYQQLQEPAGSTPLYAVMEEYARDQDKWISDFSLALEKMLDNGYGANELVTGPDQWTDVTCPRQNSWSGSKFYSCYKNNENYNQVEGFYCKVRSRLDNRYVQGESSGSIVMWEASNGDNQLWRPSSIPNMFINKATGLPLVTRNGEGQFTYNPSTGQFISSATGKAFDRGWNQSNGATIGTWTAHGGINQKFDLDCDA